MPASDKQNTRLEQKATKRHQPYKAKQPNSRPKHVPFPTSSPLAPSRSSSDTTWTPRHTFRDVCLELIRRKYPTFTPTNDYEILSLSDGHYKGSTDPARMRENLRAELEMHCTTPASRERQLQYATDTLNMKADCTGVKPRPGDPGVCVQPIPNSEYSIRLFPGSIAANEYCMDFVLTSTGEPANSPFPFQLFSGPGPSVLTGTMPVVQLLPLECSFGIPQHKIPPGTEKFLLRDGQGCILRRPGHKDVRFTVPVRRRPQGDSQTEDILQFPDYITI